MSFPVFASGDVLNASDMNAVGLWLVKSQAVGSGVSSVTVTGAFSADYDSYRISYSGYTGSTAGAALTFRCVTSGGADNGSLWYGNSFYVGVGVAGALTNANTVNGIEAFVGGADTSKQSAMFDVLGPYNTQRTKLSFTDADSSYFRIGAYILVDNNSYTGLKISVNAGTLTGGTIRVYGYRN